VGRRAEIQPAWLVSLLNQWAIHDLRSQTGGLGYASGSSWMRGLKSSPASSIDPTGYAARDFRDIERVIKELDALDRPMIAAVMMYYRPWVIRSFIEAGFPFNTSVYYARLHRGHSQIAKRMDEIKAERATSLEKLGVHVL
jgi:hypothetical protein